MIRGRLYTDLCPEPLLSFDHQTDRSLSELFSSSQNPRNKNVMNNGLLTKGFHFLQLFRLNDTNKCWFKSIGRCENSTVLSTSGFYLDGEMPIGVQLLLSLVIKSDCTSSAVLLGCHLQTRLSLLLDLFLCR